MENKIKKEENKSFCLAPWISAHTFPDGRTFPCCVWDIGNPIGNINDQNLKDILKAFRFHPYVEVVMVMQ